MEKLRIGMSKRERCTHDEVVRTGIIVYMDAIKYAVQFPKGYKECYFRDRRKRAKGDVNE